MGLHMTTDDVFSKRNTGLPHNTFADHFDLKRSLQRVFIGVAIGFVLVCTVWGYFQ